MAWCAKGPCEVARVVLAGCCGPGQAIRSVPNGATAATGLYEAEATAERRSPAAKVSPAGICGTGGTTAYGGGRVRHRVRVCAGRQDARPMEIQRSTGLDEPVAGVAGWRPVIQITAQMRVLVAIEPVDGRKGIDSLVRLCQDKLAEDPFSGCVFVFRSRSGTAIRLLTYDGQGCWLAQKRLSKGRFVWWPEASEPAKPLEAYEAHLLMAAGDVSRVRAAPMWRRVGRLK
jgi:transposase